MTWPICIWNYCPRNGSHFVQVFCVITHWGLYKNGWHFPGNIFQCIFFDDKIWLLIKISMVFVFKVRLTKCQHRHGTGDELLHEPVLTYQKSEIYDAICHHRVTTIVPSNGNTLYHMMTSSNGNIFGVTGPLWVEFTGHLCIPLTKATDAELWWFFFHLRLNKRLSKQSWGWWFETPSRSLWCH